jgi:hypothetical protein
MFVKAPRVFLLTNHSWGLSLSANQNGNEDLCGAGQPHKSDGRMGRGRSFKKPFFQIFVQNRLRNLLGTPGLHFLSILVHPYPDLT